MKNIFKERLNKLMTEHNINQLGLAKELGITQSTLSRNINGVHRPKAEIIEKIAKYFNVSVDYLLGNTDSRSVIIQATTPPSTTIQSNETLIALHNQTESLSEEQLKQVISYVQFLKSQENK
ncbi:MAG: helix-turn-helix domain-containing protein [Anaeroplasma sp.]